MYYFRIFLMMFLFSLVLFPLRSVAVPIFSETSVEEGASSDRHVPTSIEVMDDRATSLKRRRMSCDSLLEKKDHKKMCFFSSVSQNAQSDMEVNALGVKKDPQKRMDRSLTSILMDRVKISLNDKIEKMLLERVCLPLTADEIPWIMHIASYFYSLMSNLHSGVLSFYPYACETLDCVLLEHHSVEKTMFLKMRCSASYHRMYYMGKLKEIFCMWAKENVKKAEMEFKEPYWKNVTFEKTNENMRQEYSGVIRKRIDEFLLRDNILQSIVDKNARALLVSLKKSTMQFMLKYIQSLLEFELSRNLFIVIQKLAVDSKLVQKDPAIFSGVVLNAASQDMIFSFCDTIQDVDKKARVLLNCITRLLAEEDCTKTNNDIYLFLSLINVIQHEVLLLEFKFIE